MVPQTWSYESKWDEGSPVKGEAAKTKLSWFVRATDSSPHEYEFVSLNEVFDIIVQSRSMRNRKSESSARIFIVPQSNSKPSIPTIVIHKSSKTIRLPQRFSPTLNYILMVVSRRVMMKL